jgi:gamma-glutamyl-gamma-aminobutyraldehyde dehydrogenase
MTAAHPSLEIRNPANGSLITTVPLASADDVDGLVARAQKAFDAGAWAGLAPRERGAALLRLAALMERDAELLARLDSEDAGKPITECREGDVPGAIDTIRWFAEAADKLTTETFATASDILAFTEREPFGVVAAILPWNYPLAMTAWKVGPALAAGNSLILKPADATPRSALHLASLATEAGIPDGILQVATGDGSVTGAALAAHPGIGAISFTGSTGTGRAVLTAAAASNLKRVSLEMGGKSPHLVMPDALEFGDALIDGIAEAAFLTSGQNCTAGSRVLVHESLYGEVTQRLGEAASSLVLGDPSDPATQLGPVINEIAADRILAAIAGAISREARVVAGGDEIAVVPGGRYIPATVLADLAPDDPILRTEIFGPVTTVQSFTTRDEAIAMANAVDYGLAATVWTKNIDDALAVARAVEAGIVSVGAYSEGDLTVPFGGWKMSGFGGAEKSLGAFRQWTREKSIWIQLERQ